MKYTKQLLFNSLMQVYEKFCEEDYVDQAEALLGIAVSMRNANEFHALYMGECDAALVMIQNISDDESPCGQSFDIVVYDIDENGKVEQNDIGVLWGYQNALTAFECNILCDKWNEHYCKIPFDTEGSILERMIIDGCKIDMDMLQNATHYMKCINFSKYQ